VSILKLNLLFQGSTKLAMYKRAASKHIKILTEASESKGKSHKGLETVCLLIWSVMSRIYQRLLLFP